MYKDIVGRYLRFIKSKRLDKVSGVFIRDLLRHSLCVGMDLPSQLNYKEAGAYVDDCAEYILNGYNYSEWSRRYCMGVLEACIQCLDLTLKKGSNINGKVSK